MDKLKEFVFEHHSTLSFWVCAVVSFGLLIGGMLAPPLGAISPSVLYGVAELFAFASLGVLPSAIKEGRSFKATYKDASIEIGKRNDEN